MHHQPFASTGSSSEPRTSDVYQAITSTSSYVSAAVTALGSLTLLSA